MSACPNINTPEKQHHEKCKLFLCLGLLNLPLSFQRQSIPRAQTIWFTLEITSHLALSPLTPCFVLLLSADSDGRLKKAFWQTAWKTHTHKLSSRNNRFNLIGCLKYAPSERMVPTCKQTKTEPSDSVAASEASEGYTEISDGIAPSTHSNTANRYPISPDMTAGMRGVA